VKEHRAVNALRTAPTSQRQPPEVLPFSSFNFVLPAKKETLKGNSLVKEGLGPRLSWLTATLLCAPSI